jgi:hypothetical protein
VRCVNSAAAAAVDVAGKPIGDSLSEPIAFSGCYNAHGAKLILSEVNREHGRAAVDGLIRELELERIFGFKPGSVFDGGLA